MPIHENNMFTVNEIMQFDKTKLKLINLEEGEILHQKAQKKFRSLA